ncbi:MAG: glycosyltransferase family 2 protein, partial [Atopobium sp.]|nr:glycosyltransferase family 2 protein [Atopobium sp.]
MPKVSFVIPAYNIESYIGRCIQSVKNQTFGDFEAIIVDDASTDSTPEKIVTAVGDDKRFKVVTHATNQGLHLARKTAAAHTKGEWVFCLDGDDEVTPDFLEQVVARIDQNPVDILHLGITVIPENGVSEAEAEGFGNFINQQSHLTQGEEVLCAIYDEGYGQKIDWRTTQRLYRGELFRSAFAEMTSERLVRAEDAYEVFVLSDKAQSADGFESCRGLLYHFGIGVTGASRISLDKFGEFCYQFLDNIEQTELYIGKADNAAYVRSFEGMKHKLMELLIGDWKSRLAPEDQEAALEPFAILFGPSVAARELYRFVRDIAYEAIATGTELPEDSDAYRYRTYAKKYAALMHQDEG